MIPSLANQKSQQHILLLSQALVVYREWGNRFTQNGGFKFVSRFGTISALSFLLRGKPIDNSMLYV